MRLVEQGSYLSERPDVIRHARCHGRGGRVWLAQALVGPGEVELTHTRIVEPPGRLRIADHDGPGLTWGMGNGAVNTPRSL